MNQNFLLLIKLINKIKPSNISPEAGKLKYWANKIGIWILIIVGLIFLTLFGLLIWAEVYGPLPTYISNLASYFILFCMVFSLIPSLLDVISIAWTLLNYKSVADQAFLLDAQHDMALVAELRQFDKDYLELAKSAIKLKTDRIERRLSLVLGNTEKATVFGIFLIGWNAWKENSVSEIFQSSFGTPLSLIAALLAGLLFGSFLMRILLNLYAYRIGIIDLALNSKDKPVEFSRHYDEPKPSGVRYRFSGILDKAQRIKLWVLRPFTRVR